MREYEITYQRTAKLEAPDLDAAADAAEAMAPEGETVVMVRPVTSPAPAPTEMMRS